MIEILSPIPGVLWQRPEPSAEPHCAPGDQVAAGQQIASLEVMKMFAPVEASSAGVFVAYLAEDGATVEAGQVVARIQEVP